MRHWKLIGLSSLVVIALAAINASAASAALPEFNAEFPAQLSASANSVKIETASGSLKVKCKGGLVSDAIEGPKELSRLGGANLRDCSENGVVCTTETGTTPGEILFYATSVTIGYIDEAAKRVGVRFGTEDPASQVLETFECGATKVVLTGSVIGEWSPINEAVRPPRSKPKPPKGTLVFNEKKGAPSIAGFEGETPEPLEASIDGGPMEPAAFKLKGKLGVTEAIELKG